MTESPWLEGITDAVGFVGGALSGFALGRLLGMDLLAPDGKGVLAKVASELAQSEADISHIDMDDEVALDTVDLRFVVAVRDVAHLGLALHNLNRSEVVVRALRSKVTMPG